MLSPKSGKPTEPASDCVQGRALVLHPHTSWENTCYSDASLIYIPDLPVNRVEPPLESLSRHSWKKSGRDELRMVARSAIVNGNEILDPLEGLNRSELLRYVARYE